MWKNLVSTFRKDKSGATAIEAAVVFPLLILTLFAVFGFGSFMYGTHQAQRFVEKTAREVRVMDNPTKDEMYAVLKGNLDSSMFGTFTPNVATLSQYNGNYAELSVDYAFQIEIPIFSLLKLNHTATTQVKLREMP